MRNITLCQVNALLCHTMSGQPALQNNFQCCCQIKPNELHMDDFTISPSRKRQRIDEATSTTLAKRPAFSETGKTTALRLSDVCDAQTESDDELLLPFKLPSSSMPLDRVYCNLCATQTPRDEVYRCKTCDLFICSDKCSNAHLTHCPDHHVVSPKQQQQVKSLAELLVDAFMGSMLPANHITPIPPTPSPPVRAPTPPPPSPPKPPVMPVPLCTKHKIVCTLYDATTNVFVCSTCVPPRSHDIFQIPASVQQHRVDGINRLESLVKRLNERVVEANQHTASLQTQLKQISQTIHTGFARLRDLLKVREQELEQQLSAAFKQANRETTRTRNSWVSIVNDVQKFVGLLGGEKSFDGPDGSTLPRMRLLSSTDKLIRALDKSVDAQFHPINSEVPFENLEKLLGEPAGRIWTDAAE